MTKAGFFLGIYVFTAFVSILGIANAQNEVAGDSMPSAGLPLAEDGEFETVKNVPLTSVLPIYNPRHEALRYQTARDPLHGKVTFDGQGGFTFTPAPEYSGMDSFSYTVGRIHGVDAPDATVMIAVDLGPHPPSVVDISVEKAGEPGATGAGIFNVDGQDQTVAETVNGGTPAVYFAHIHKNVPDSTVPVRITALPGPAFWTVRYFDGTSRSHEITGPITSDAGYIGVADSVDQVVRIEVTPPAGWLQEREFADVIRAGRATDPAHPVADAVGATTLATEVDRSPAKFRLAVTPDRDMRLMHVTAPTITYNQRLDYAVTVTNLGAEPEQFQVALGTPPPHWKYSLSDATYGIAPTGLSSEFTPSVAPGASFDATLVIEIDHDPYTTPDPIVRLQPFQIPVKAQMADQNGVPFGDPQICVGLVQLQTLHGIKRTHWSNSHWQDPDTAPVTVLDPREVISFWAEPSNLSAPWPDANHIRPIWFGANWEPVPGFKVGMQFPDVPFSGEFVSAVCGNALFCKVVRGWPMAVRGRSH